MRFNHGLRESDQVLRLRVTQLGIKHKSDL